MAEISKTRFGLSFFDDTFGGVYPNSQILCYGRHGSQKSILVGHFLNQGLEYGENVILLTENRAASEIIIGESYGFPFNSAVCNKQLLILEYSAMFSGGTRAPGAIIPPEAFDELAEMIEAYDVKRVAFDSLLPWVMVEPGVHVNEHVFSFVRSCERLGILTLGTILKPVSRAAFALKKRLEDYSQIVLELDHSKGVSHSFRVVKYVGEQNVPSAPIYFDVVPGNGICRALDPCVVQEKVAVKSDLSAALQETTPKLPPPPPPVKPNPLPPLRDVKFSFMPITEQKETPSRVTSSAPQLQTPSAAAAKEAPRLLPNNLPPTRLLPPETPKPAVPKPKTPAPMPMPPTRFASIYSPDELGGKPKPKTTAEEKTAPKSEKKVAIKPVPRTINFSDVIRPKLGDK